MLQTNHSDTAAGPGGRPQVVGLSEHRTRRGRRLSLARAMWSEDPVRAELLGRLADLADLTGADRAAAVWIDEYGDTRAHPFVTIDLISDVPRRQVPVEPLERAWESGLPGVYEGVSGSLRRGGEGTSLFAVALGSDGSRAWFLVSDSVGGRPRLSEDERRQALFLAGECASALLHQDLDPSETPDGGARSFRAFVGMPVLEDLKDAGDPPAVTAKVSQRFVLVRLARTLLEEDPAFTLGSPWDERVEATRAELVRCAGEGGDPEGEWSPLLEAIRSQRLDAVAAALVGAGERAEADGHTNGALELYRCAYEAAAQVMHAAVAIDAARFQGRVLRRLAHWEESTRMYGLAHRVAVAAELWGPAAQVLVGLASVRQELGNLPEARAWYHEALGTAQRAQDRHAVAIAHHGLLGLEHVAGDLPAALRHGWTAVGAYQDPAGRLRCLASLAGVLVDYGDRAAGEDAWTVVARESREVYYRIYAHDALAYLAALRGDLPEFERQAAACDALGWEDGPRSAKAEILFYRGVSYRALGLRDAARRWLERAVAFAHDSGLNRTLFRAEAALEALEREDREETPAGTERTTPSAPPEIREGLREMRRAVAGALS